MKTTIKQMFRLPFAPITWFMFAVLIAAPIAWIIWAKYSVTLVHQILFPLTIIGSIGILLEIFVGISANDKAKRKPK